MWKEDTKEESVNIVSFEDYQEKAKTEPKTPVVVEGYFDEKDKLVTRGELLEVLSQVMSNVDKELTDSFKRVVMTTNLLDIVVKVLSDRNLIEDADFQKAIDILKEEQNRVKEDTQNGSK